MKIVEEHGAYVAKGERVFLRELTAADATPRYLTWFQNDSVTRFLSVSDLSVEDVVGYMEHGRKTNSYFMYGICMNETRLHIGNIKIGPIDWTTMRSDLVTVIGDTDYWGKGLASEAISLGNKLAFDVYQIRELAGNIDPANIGSLKTYFRAGWGDTKKVAKPQPHEADLVCVSCFNPEYYSVEITEGEFQSVHPKTS